MAKAVFRWQTQIEAEDDGRLLREFLRGRLGISRQMLHSLKFTGEILLNGEQVTVRAVVKAGDTVELVLPESEAPRAEPEALPLDIVYEDEDILIVNKPPQMISHPVPPEPSGTLANAIAHHWIQQGEERPVRLVTRLDRDTSGLVLVAKHPLAQHFYSPGEGDLVPRIHKSYWLVVRGRLTKQEGLISAPIDIDSADATRRLVAEGGREAHTRFRTLQVYDSASLVEAELLTGRTHQLRVHFAWLGYPLLGDDRYGEPCDLINRQALHARALRLLHVRSRKWRDFEAALPTDMQSLIDKLGRD